jgi:hypothetical protein
MNWSQYGLERTRIMMVIVIVMAIVTTTVAID